MRPESSRPSLRLVLALALATACGAGSSTATPDPTSSSTPDPMPHPTYTPRSSACLAGVAVLRPGGSTFAPPMDVNVTTYDITVSSGTTHAALTFFGCEEGESLSVLHADGSVAPLGSELDVAIPAAGSFATVTIRVTAEDRTTTRDYAFRVSQRPSADQGAPATQAR